MTRFDAAADRILEPLRINKASIALFGFASFVGDFSIAWHVIGFVRAIGSTDRLQQALALSIALGVESLIVNQGVKRMFRRERPTTSGDDRFDVRTPSTSSFPSGHASSATFAAIILISFTGWPWGIAWVGVAVVIALSRVVVRIHHLSDIVGGVITGAVLGAIAVPIIQSLI
jgi:undecaprenyl-diphosphatase